VQQSASLAGGEHGDRVRLARGAQVRALQRIDGDVEREPAAEAARRAELFADEQHGRGVALALADHDRAVDGQAAQHAAHGRHRHEIGAMAVAETDGSRGGDGSLLHGAAELGRQIRRQPRGPALAAGGVERTQSGLGDRDGSVRHGTSHLTPSYCA
jgi:hypothetical protein